MNTMRNEVTSKLLEHICSTYMVEMDEIVLDDSLADSGIIDSFGHLEISAFVESAFDIKVEKIQLTRKNFDSVNRIVDFVITASESSSS